MPKSNVFFIGTESEAAHHVRPLQDRLDVRLVEPAEAVRVAQPGDVAIFFSEHFDRFRECSRLLKMNSVALIYAVDGILEWRNAWENRADEPACPWTMRPALADKIACIGRHQARLLRDWGNGGKLEVIGLPRLDSLAAKNLCAPRSRSGEGPFRLLVMTAKWPGFTPGQIERTKTSLRDLRDWLKMASTNGGRSIEVTWRLTHGLAQELEVQNSLTEVSGNELSHVLSRVDAVISTPSTALLESMLCGLPTASLDYHQVPAYVQPAWTITHRDAIGSTVADLQNPPANRMYFQQKALADELECVGSATDRMCVLIRKMQDIATICLRDRRPMTFPDNLVPVQSAAAVDFPAAELFPEHAAFRESNSLHLQSELAHARREIGLLQAQIVQLRSELNQAHGIFDEIHRHPIAGPVVRLRQKLIDTLSQLSERKAKLESLEKP